MHLLDCPGTPHPGVSGICWYKINEEGELHVMQYYSID